MIRLERFTPQCMNTTKDIPNWVTIDYEDIWENKLSNDYFEIDCDCSDYTYGHIFKKTV